METITMNPFVIPGVKPIIDPQLNKDYTFYNFIEGQSNRLARSAGIAVSKNGMTAFNPLFIYGASGLGKTHLAQAIGNKSFQKGNIVIYVTANQLKNQFLKATDQVVNFYKQLDLLIIDDIQDLKNDVRTQGILLDIISHLWQNNKQVVITSNKPPSDLEGFEVRLYSRFKWGLSADLQIPDFETKLSILRHKCNFNDDVLSHLAGNLNSSVRELESAITLLIAEHDFNKRIIDIDLAKEVIDKLIGKKRDITIEYIQKLVCKFFNMPEEWIQLNNRKREIVQVRQIAMYFSKRLTKSSLAAIGVKLGDKDHATVLHACKTVNNLMETDKRFLGQIDEIEKLIKG